MLGNKKNSSSDAAKSVFTSSIHLLANVAAVAAAFILTGPIFDSTIEWIQDFSARQYGSGENIQSIISFVWFGLIGLGTFAFCRATVSTAFIMFGTAVAARFL